MRDRQRSQEARRRVFRSLHLSTDRERGQKLLEVSGKGRPPKAFPYDSPGAKTGAARTIAPGEYSKSEHSRDKQMSGQAGRGCLVGFSRLLG